MQSPKVIVDLLRTRGWLTAGQLGRLVGISQTYMYHLVINEDISSLRIGNIYRIYTEECIRILHQYSSRPETNYVRKQAIDAAHEYLSNIGGDQ